jgi:hypothetical protein
MQVIEWYHQIAESKGKQGANLALQQLHAIYARAIDWELFEGKNPADRIKKFPKLSRERKKCREWKRIFSPCSGPAADAMKLD